MSGFDLIRRVREQPGYAHVPILVISGDSDPGTPERIRALGANAFFPKPYSPSAVRKKLETLLNAIPSRRNFLSPVAGLRLAQTSGEFKEILDRLTTARGRKSRRWPMKFTRLRERTGGIAPQALSPARQRHELPRQPTRRAANERLDVVEKRSSELAQTKVEASQKFPIKLTGTLLFNAFLNGR